MRKCDNCGREFEPREEWHRYCSSRCRQEAEARGGSQPTPAGGPRPTSRAVVETNFRFDENYLKSGYFRDPDRKQLQVEIVDTLARDVAWVLSKTDVAKPGQLRRFFNQLRAIERSINLRRTFEEAQADIAALKPAVARQVSRKLVGENFKQFIDRNVDLAAQNKENFLRGFIPHFAAVLGYFEYFKPEKKGE